jgi:SAM-dependent methyltransferase
MKNTDLIQLKQSWTYFGKTEPYWSVLTHDKFRKGNLNENSIEEFYRSGEKTINEFEKILNTYQSTFNDKIVFEFGCGVGRLVKPISKFCKKIYGLDISQPHLDIAKIMIPEAEFFLVDNYKMLPTNICPDIIYSVMALQHNRPRLMRICIFLLLKSLKNGGIALLHIPYKIENYINYTDVSNRMEMHFLSKNDVKKIIGQCSCEILTTIETHSCGQGNLDCIYVIRK